MPRTKRRFADDDTSSSEDDDDDSDDDDDEEDHAPPVVSRSGGKQLRMMARPGGGKQLMRPQEESEKESESESESEDEPPPRPISRGGKQFRPSGGKTLRPPQPESEDDDDDDDDDDESFDDEDEKDEPPPAPVYRASGGKSLSRMQRGGNQLGRQQPEEDEESDDDDDDDDESEGESEDDEEVERDRSSYGGKQLRPSGGKQMRPPGGGKQLRPSSEPTPASTGMGGKQLARPATSGGKQLARPASSGGKQLVRPATGGGKQLRPPGGKQLRPPGGKQLRPPKPTDEDSEEDSDESEEEVEEEEEEEAAPEKTSADDMEIESDEEKKEEPKPKEASAPPKPKETPVKEASEPEDMEVSEEESSDDSENELDMETFDTQKLVQGESDQAYLDSLPEFEREAILGERFESFKNAQDTKRALRESKKKERAQRKVEKEKTKKKPPPKKPAPKANEKKVPDTSKDEEIAASLATSRESTRNKDATGQKGKKKAALAAIRSERASKAPEKKDDSDIDYSSDEESDDDYEADGSFIKPWQQKKKAASQVRAESEEDEEEDEDDGHDAKSSQGADAEHEDYVKITIPRRRLARWCNEPFFEKAVKGRFVRLGIGKDKHQKSTYRFCQIVDVVDGPNEYRFPAPRDTKPVSTSKRLKLKFGEKENTFLMVGISDSRPTEDEVAKFLEHTKNNRKAKILTKREATKLFKSMDSIVNNYTYTKEDIEKAVQAKKKSSKRVANIGLEQERSKIAVQAAREAVKEAEAQLHEARKAHLEAASEDDAANATNAVEAAEEALKEVNAELELKLEEQRKIVEASEKRKQRAQNTSKVQHWIKVNERAAKVNQNMDFQSYKEQREKEKKEQTGEDGAPKFNPYARRKVKPKILWEVGQKDDTEEAPKVKGSNETRDEEATDKNENSNGREGGDAKKTDSNGSSQLGSTRAVLPGKSHQFAIDEEVLVQTSNLGMMASLGLGVKRPPRKRVRTGISLAEYQERKAAGTL